MRAAPGRFAVVGSGWRGELFLRLARMAPEHFHVGGVVTRSAERGAQVEAGWGVPTYRTVEEAVAAGEPEVVIVAVPWEQAPVVTRQLAHSGIRVLVETPPAPDADGLRALWAEVGASGLVQVAEQYLHMPAHAARLALVRAGAIGEVTSVQVSSTHGYHAASMIRGFLGAGFGPVTVRARAFEAPLVDPLGRSGWTGSTTPRPLATTIASLDFGPGRMGLYDFTETQWFNPLRARRIVVRGSLGEIVDTTLVRLAAPDTPVESQLLRRLTGLDLNLEGLEVQHLSIDGTVVWRNGFVGSRLSEDDLAVAGLLAAVVAWARDEGPAPYPLADACQDQLLSLAIDDAARSGREVSTAVEPWGRSPAVPPARPGA